MKYIAGIFNHRSLNLWLKCVSILFHIIFGTERTTQQSPQTQGSTYVNISDMVFPAFRRFVSNSFFLGFFFW